MKVLLACATRKRENLTVRNSAPARSNEREMVEFIIAELRGGAR